MPAANRFGLGLRSTENRLAEPNADWPSAFALEATRLKAALGDVIIAIEHYGSTSIPGLAAKPIIDLLVGVADLSQAAQSSAVMAGLGYDERGYDLVPGHHIFGHGEARTHLAHFVPHDSDFWRRPLIFRDRLRVSADLRERYEALKRDLVARHPNDRPAYTKAKGEFVLSVVRGEI